MKTLMMAGFALMLSTVALAKPELVITQTGNGKNSQVMVDFVADESKPITAFQFRMKLGKMEGTMLLDNCTADLPKTHVGACSLKNGVLTYIVYSNSNAELGTTAVGSVQVPSKLVMEKKINGEFDVYDVVFSDANGRQVEAEVLRNFE